jgi:hypothetical protein
VVEEFLRHMPRALDGAFRPLDSALRVSCYPAVLVAHSLFVGLTCLEGVTRAGEARVLVAGPDPWAFDLPLRLFSSPPKRTTIGKAPLWRLHSALQELAGEFDLVVAWLDKTSARVFPQATYLRIPEWVDTGRALPENPASLLRASDSLARDVRVARQNGLETTLSTSLDDFDDFYESMYVPFIQKRHGSLARLRNKISLRNCFRRGGLVWLSHQGKHLAGLVFELSKDTVSTRAYAMCQSYIGPAKKGVATTLYYRAFTHATECGCRVLDLGGCRACLTDGVLHYKRKWDVRLHARPTNKSFALISWAAWTPAVGAFLADFPLLHEDGNGLTAVAATTIGRTAVQADLDTIYRTIQVPGVDRHVIINPEGWAREVVPLPSTTLVEGFPVASKLLSKEQIAGLACG